MKKKTIKKYQAGKQVGNNVSLSEKRKIAQQLYKDNPTKVFADALDRAQKAYADSVETSKKPPVKKKGGTTKSKSKKK